MNLSTKYLGLDLKSPLVPSASPLSRKLDMLLRLEDAGAGAVVLYSLFEEDINRESQTLDRYLTQGANSHSEALTYFQELPSYRTVGPEAYLDHIVTCKKRLDIPVIASLNGVSVGGWLRYAKLIEEAGADALELNLYYLPTDPDITSLEVEQVYLDVVREVRRSIDIPLAVKLSPYFSTIAHMAKRFTEYGARGLVLFNRFYQPDLDLENLDIVPNLKLSLSDEMRLPLRWIAIMYGRIKADFALTTGIHTAEDALKGIAAGASIVQLASELLHYGPDRIAEIEQEMIAWLEAHEYDSLETLRGSLSQLNCGAPAAFERAQYIQMVGSFDY